MAAREERQRQARLARDLAAGRPTSVVPQYAEPDPAEASLDQYVVKSHEADHLVCHAWNGETEGDDDVLIVKNYLLRRSVFEYSQNGKKIRNGIKYTYGKKNIHWERLAEIVETEEKEQQIIVPSYVTEEGGEEKNDPIGPDVIVAEVLATAVVVTIDEEDVDVFLIHRDGREWARKFGEEDE